MELYLALIFAVSHPEGSQPNVYGSHWYESQEPVVKKRRRRSSLLVGLTTRLLPRQLEEHEYDYENHEVNVAKFCEEKIECNLMNVIERQEVEPDNDIHGLVGNEIGSGTGSVVGTHETNVSTPDDHEGRTDSIREQVFDTVGYMEEKDATNSNTCIGDSTGLNSEFAGDDTALQVMNGNISLNSSNLCFKSPVTGDFPDMSKTSPCSMSPDFPISPNTCLYQEESYIDVGNAEATDTANDNDGCGLVDCDYSNAHCIKNTNTIFKKCLKSSNAEQASDSSLSDKENSVVTSLNITPEAKEVCNDNISPGFMSLCKAFAGKMVNFVRTSPSYLTSSVVESNIAPTCAFPDLAGNTSLNFVSKELPILCPKSDINKSLANLGADISAGNSSCLSGAENMMEIGCVLGNFNIETRHKSEKRGKQETTSELPSGAKATNPVLFGSAKKKRDRKTFFDTFNAVSDELKRDRSTEESNEGCESKSDIGMEELVQKSGVQTGLERVEPKSSDLDIEEHDVKQRVNIDFSNVLSNSLNIDMESHEEKTRLKNNGDSVHSKSELSKNAVSVVEVNDTHIYNATDKQSADERIICDVDDSDNMLIHEHTVASVPMDADTISFNDLRPVEVDTCVLKDCNKQPGSEVQISVELDRDPFADETLVDACGYNVFANNTIVCEDNSCGDVIKEVHEVNSIPNEMRIDCSGTDKDYKQHKETLCAKRNICQVEANRRRKRRVLDIPYLIVDENMVHEFAKEKLENVNESSVVGLCENKPKIISDSNKEENYLEKKSKKPTGRRRSGRVLKLSVLDASCILEDLDAEQPNHENVQVQKKIAEEVVESKTKRKLKDDTYEALENLYRNKNFVKPKENKSWKTVLESPSTSSDVFGKKQLQRHIEFERPTQMKLRRRMQKAVKNGWDPKKRKRSELKDDYVQVKLANLWSELDQGGDNSLQSKLRSIVETV